MHTRKVLCRLKRMAGISLLVLSAAALVPSPAAAESMVAVLLTGNLPRYRTAHEAFMRILQAGGHGPEKLKVFVQAPNADKMSLANSVRRSIAAGAEVVITYGAPAAEAARKEAQGVPVLFADVYDPVALGLVKSLPSPGTDMTGAESAVPLDRLVDQWQRIRPIRQLGVLFTATEGGSALQAQEMTRIGTAVGFAVLKQDVPAANGVPAALSAILDKIDALFLTESVAVTLHGEEVVAQAHQRGVPVISLIPGLGEKGAVLNLEADPEEQGKLAAVHLLQILAGQKAHMLPVRSPKKINLVVNSGVAGKLSLSLPAEVVSAADRVIN